MKKNSYQVLFLILALFLLVLVGISQFVSKTNNTLKSGNKIKVIASFYPLYYFLSRIAGDKANIKNITPQGAEPHDYEPTAQDIAYIESSDLLILNGNRLEAWANRIKENLKQNQVAVVLAGEGFEGRDPHIWLAPPLAKKMAANILSGLIKVDPQNQDYYLAHAKKLETELDQLASQYQQGLMSCRQKVIITPHDAFAYLSDAYGLKQVSISGLSPDDEPTPKQIAEVADLAKKQNVKYIFFESLVSPKLSETIASEIGAKTLVLDPIEGVSEKDMQAGKNYFTIMLANLNNLQTALECQ